MDQSLLDSIIKTLKDYWFLITLAASVLLAAAYMIVFRVSPWDQQRAAKLRRDRVRFHNAMGYTLIESGHFADARAEFDEAINLSAENQTALNGRYLAKLFLNVGSTAADPAIAFAILDHVSETEALRRDHHLHIIDKLLGDLHMSISNIPKAAEYYRSALDRKPNYANALYALGWHYYQVGLSVEGMEHAFRKLTEIAPLDYRGFHGLGYALYMHALGKDEDAPRSSLIEEAAKQSGVAKNLVFNQLNIVMDFGEVARSVDPGLSLFFHKYGKEIMTDPSLLEIGDNPYPLLARLLTSNGEVYIRTKNEKLAWIAYQMALDYLAMQRMPGAADYAAEYQRLFDEAESLDPDREMRRIYDDQLAILDRLLPARVDN
jgi:Flp pilus assembly protein TadD